MLLTAAGVWGAGEAGTGPSVFMTPLDNCTICQVGENRTDGQNAPYRQSSASAHDNANIAWPHANKPGQIVDQCLSTNERVVKQWFAVANADGQSSQMYEALFHKH